MSDALRTRQMIGTTMEESSGVDHPANASQFGGEGWLVMKASTSATKGETVTTETAPAATETAPGTAPAPATESTVTVETATEQYEARIAELEAQLAAATAAAAAAPPNGTVDDPEDDPAAGGDGGADEDEEEAVAKAMAAMPEAVRRHFETALKERDEAMAAASKAAETATAAEWTAKAADLGVGDAETFGPVLRACHAALSEDGYAELDRVLRAAAEQSKEAKRTLLAASGGIAKSAVQISAEEQIQKAASEFRAADPKLTPEQAVAKAWQANPDLIQQWRDESTSTEG